MAKPHPSARDRAGITRTSAPATIVAELATVPVAFPERLLVTIAGRPDLAALFTRRLADITSAIDADDAPSPLGYAGMAVISATITL
jgi:hypothetical protein